MICVRFLVVATVWVATEAIVVLRVKVRPEDTVTTCEVRREVERESETEVEREAVAFPL